MSQDKHDEAFANFSAHKQEGEKYYDEQIVGAFLDEISELAKDHPAWVKIFKNSFTNTLDEALVRLEDGTSFVLTGDIPAMWLRDSTAQLKPYLSLAKKDRLLLESIAGLVKRQMRFIVHDVYANAFNIEENWQGHHETDRTELSGYIWERKYEVDSLCYPLQLAYLLWQKTGHEAHFDSDFVKASSRILEVFRLEQDHSRSPYSFVRATSRQEDTLQNDGLGPAFARTGMTWSGFRPSDDACVYSYLVPSNMFAVVVLTYLAEIYERIDLSSHGLSEVEARKLAAEARSLASEIDEGIKKHAIMQNQAGDNIYAYEVDGLGNKLLMDDPNVPSLLSAPYLGYCSADDETYLATRKTILSSENPYYYEGKYASGIGSSHTFYRYIWPIALAIEGLTTHDKATKERLLDLMCACDGGKFCMHESFHVDDPSLYSREWFSWANMMFVELMLDYYDLSL